MRGFQEREDRTVKEFPSNEKRRQNMFYTRLILETIQEQPKEGNINFGLNRLKYYLWGGG